MAFEFLTMCKKNQYYALDGQKKKIAKTLKRKQAVLCD